MDEDLKRREEVQRGDEARRLLEEPLLVEAFAMLRQRYIAEWESSPARDTEGREKLWLMNRLISSVENQLKQLLETGKLASIQLEQKRTLRDRAKAAIDWLGA